MIVGGILAEGAENQQRSTIYTSKELQQTYLGSQWGYPTVKTSQ